MATAVTRANVRAEIGYTQENGNPIAPSTLSSVWPNGDLSYTSGTGARQIDRLYLRQTEIAASATLTLDCDAGSLLDLNNEAITFARLKFIGVSLDPVGGTGSTSVTLNGGAANVVVNVTMPLVSDGTGAAAGVIRNTGATGWQVTAGTADKVVVVNNSSTLVAFVNVALGGNAT